MLSASWYDDDAMQCRPSTTTIWFIWKFLDERLQLLISALLSTGLHYQWLAILIFILSQIYCIFSHKDFDFLISNYIDVVVVELVSRCKMCKKTRVGELVKGHQICYNHIILFKFLFFSLSRYVICYNVVLFGGEIVLIVANFFFWCCGKKLGW